MNIRYRVTLSEEERMALQDMAWQRSIPGARSQACANSAGGRPGVKRGRYCQSSTYQCRDNLSHQTVFCAAGFGGGIARGTPSRWPPQALCKEEALLIATACSAPPAGRARWTLDLLVDTMVSLTAHDSLSRATIGRRLAENNLKPWQHKMWCVPKVDSEIGRAHV